jgi:hypothetical protein
MTENFNKISLKSHRIKQDTRKVRRTGRFQQLLHFIHAKKHKPKINLLSEAEHLTSI